MHKEQKTAGLTIAAAHVVLLGLASSPQSKLPVRRFVIAMMLRSRPLTRTYRLQGRE